METMLTENQVVGAVKEHLEKKGWCIESTSSTSERGPDILAKKGETTLVVEAKGGTSSKDETSRHGEPFDSGQKKDHVAKALYEAAKVFSAGQHQAGIALPSDKRHSGLIEDIRPALKKLGVAVFLVNDDCTVRE